MAEGDYFKNEEPKKAKKAEIELIDDPQELLGAYDRIEQSIKETDIQSHEHIIKLRTELSGMKTGPDDVGLLGKVINRIKNSPINDTFIGKDILEVLNKVKDFDFWHDRYSSYLEEYVKGFRVISLSAFRQIKLLNDSSEKLKEKIRQLEAGYGPRPVLIGSDRERFLQLLKLRLNNYLAAEKTGDKRKITLAIGNVLQICGSNPEKRGIAEAKLKELGAKMAYSPTLSPTNTASQPEDQNQE